VDLVRGSQSLLAINVVSSDARVAWSPDSNRIAYVIHREDKYRLYMKPVDGSGAEELLLERPEAIWGLTWSPDGKLLVFGLTVIRPDLTADYDHWAVPLTGDRKPYPLPWNTQDKEGFAKISPDGKWIAFNSSGNGPEKIYIRSFPDGTGEWVLPNAGVQPQWRNDGQELYFQKGDSLAAVDVRIDGLSVLFGTPEVLGVPNTAITLDGKRFLVLKNPGDTQ
jgi:Tol biopolymer transport system component